MWYKKLKLEVQDAISGSQSSKIFRDGMPPGMCTSVFRRTLKNYWIRT